MSFFERHQRALDYAVKHVGRLQPGQRVSLARRVLEDIVGIEHNGERWTAADRVLENIMGSSYEYQYRDDFPHDAVTFERLSAPLTDGRRSYVSPDRRYLFSHRGELWVPLESDSGVPVLPK